MSDKAQYVVLESGEYSDYTWHVIMSLPDGIDIDAAYSEAYASAEVPGWADCPDMPDVRELFVRALEARGGKVLDVMAIHLGSYDPKKPDQMRENKA